MKIVGEVRNGFVAAVLEPLVHFLLLGAAIYLVYGLAVPDVDEESSSRIMI